MVKLIEFGTKGWIRNLSKLINMVGGPIDHFVSSSKDRQLRYKPIFIVGPPRSGTTLLYQLMTAKCDTCYISNLQTIFYDMPKLGSIISKHLMNRKKGESFESNLGKTKGLLGQSESSLFWDQWIPRTKNKKIRPAEDLCANIAITSNTFRNPFVAKSVYASNNLSIFQRSLDKFLILVMLRDPFFVAQSIYFVRKTMNFNLFSVQPKGYEYPQGISIIEECGLQAMFLYKNIFDSLEGFDSKYFAVINYNDLCLNPLKEIEKIKATYDSDGDQLITKTNQIDPFKPSNTVRLNQDQVECLQIIIEQEWPNIYNQS